MSRVLFVITEDWALATHRLHLAKAAVAAGHDVAVATKISTYRPVLEELGIQVYDWRIRRGSLSIVSEIKTVLNLFSIVRNFCPDVVHAVALKPVIYAGLATRFGYKGAVVSALGGVGFVFSSQTIKAKILRFLVSVSLRLVLLGRRRALILQNQDDADLLNKHGAVKPSSIRLVRGAGVETDIFKFSKLSAEAPKVILPARILWDKGIEEFKNAARRIRRDKPNVTFVLVGDVDPQNPATVSEEQLELWLNEGQLEHLSRVPHSEMPRVYRDATIVCLPSYHEGLPKALLEAASTGRPMVAFDVSGCREIVRSGITGTLVPFGDEDALAKALIELIDDKEKLQRFGINARNVVEKEFSAEIINAKTFLIWNELLD